MAGGTKKKARKTSRKKAAEEPQQQDEEAVMFDEEVEEKHDDGEHLSSAEEEEPDDERRRIRLLEAISALGGRRRRFAERSEAAVNVSEFSIAAQGEGDRLELSDLLGTTERTPVVSVKTRKQLRVLEQGNLTLQSPLSRQESDRIQRDVSFKKAAVVVSRWKDIIQQNRRAEQLVFPLDQGSSGPRSLATAPLNARTPLEQEILGLLEANKQPILDPVLTQQEEDATRAMNLEEARARRAELQKMRALQSYYEAKSRRQNRIKSKKFHRVQNKGKRKEALARFEEMVRSDPVAALEELEKMERGRMQERMSLKHQNSSKWAKTKAVMAKYDLGARRAMQQQLEVNRDLTQKLKAPLDQEEEEEEEKLQQDEEEEHLPGFVNEAERGADPSNPWMMGALTRDPAEEQNRDLAEEEKAVVAVGEQEEEEEELDETEEELDETEEEALLRGFDARRKMRQAQEEKDDQELEEFTSLFRGKAAATSAPEAPVEAECAPQAVQEAEDEKEELEEDHAEAGNSGSTLLGEELRKIQSLLQEESELLAQEKQEDQGDQEDQELPQEAPPPPPPPPTNQKAAKGKRKRIIELNEVLTKQTTVVRAPLALTAVEAAEESEEEEEEEQQRGLIREAFAGDNVVADFLKEKRKQEDAGKPRAVDLTLPGWGEWGGIGLLPSARKRRRFRVKAPPAPPRKDERLPDVVVQEGRQAALHLHQVSALPFPFQDPLQFQASIRSPVGRAWNTECSVKKMTAPRVLTRLGAVIPPLSAEQLDKNAKDQWKQEGKEEEKEKTGAIRRRQNSRRTKR